MEKEAVIRVIAADDHRIFLDGLMLLFQDTEGIVLEDIAETCAALLESVKIKQPDVVLLDISFHRENSIEVVAQLKEISSASRVIMLTMHGTRDYITDALEAGVHGYVLKNTGRDELIHAIRKVHGGETWFSPQVTDTIMKGFSRTENFKDGRTRLTKREEEVLRLICRELTSQEIADKLCISLLTVETHRKNLISKLGVRNTAGLVRQAIERGLI